MPYSSPFAEGLRENLLQVLRNPASQRELNHLVRVCHALALVSLRTRPSSRFASDMHVVTPSQLAYDCIADLFLRQEDGRFVRLASYFEAFEPECLSDEQVLQHLRRLVGGTVHQALCRVYGEIDPTLGKILRNLKLAVHSLGHFEQIERFGEPCIAPALCETLAHLGPCPAEELERGILEHATRLRTVPDLLSAISLYLRHQSEYSRVVPVITLARVFRSVFSRVARAEIPVDSDIANHMATLDLQNTIAWACATVTKRMHRVYVGKGRIREETLAGYREAVSRYLHSRLDGEGDRESLRGHFFELNPEISKEEYFRVHRSRLEYMTRQAEQLVCDRLKK